MAGPWARGRVLIVEDDPDVARFVEINLGAAGWDATVVADGGAAVSRAEELLPDVVILDVMLLPHVDGFKIAENLRANPRTARAGIIFLTSRGQTHDVITGLTLGDDYVVKPFDPQELVVRVENVWKHTRGR